MLLGGRLHERLRQINPRKVAPQVAWFQKVDTVKAASITHNLSCIMLQKLSPKRSIRIIK